MKPLILLIGVFGAVLLIRKFFGYSFDLPFAGRIAFASMLLFTALGHFLFPTGMAAMIPNFVPSKLMVVYITGLLEILFAIGILIPSFQKQTGWMLLLFLVLVLPANVKAALEHIHYESGTSTGPGPVYLWFRIPMQLFLMLWVYLSCLRA